VKLERGHLADGSNSFGNGDWLICTRAVDAVRFPGGTLSHWGAVVAADGAPAVFYAANLVGFASAAAARPFRATVQRDPATAVRARAAVSRVWRKVKSDWDAWNARSLTEEPIVRAPKGGYRSRVILGFARCRPDQHA
jgi:hypothetical protein